MGQDESPSLLVDLCARGGSYTGIDLNYQNDDATSGPLRWNRPLVDFGLETAIEALPGLVFSLDALDHNPKTTATEGSARWQLFDPQGGLRLGGGVDLLRAWREKSPWRWIVAGWVPVFSTSREWELRTGLLLNHKFRADFTAAWSDPGTPSRWTIPVDSTLADDTTWWRSHQTRMELRVGGAPTKEISLQAWTGQRNLSDPGAGAEPSWRTFGASTFAGAQATFPTGAVTWDLEARAEQGNQTVLFDGSGRLARWPDSGRMIASTDYVNGSASAKASYAWSETVGTELTLSGAWMDLENASASPMPWFPMALETGEWASTKRVSFVIEAPLKWTWLNVSPSIGLQCRIQDGQAIPLWQELAPTSIGRSWSIPFGLQLARQGSMNGKVSYTLSGEVLVSGQPSPTPGLRHHIEMKQGF